MVEGLMKLQKKVERKEWFGTIIMAIQKRRDQ